MLRYQNTFFDQQEIRVSVLSLNIHGRESDLGGEYVKLAMLRSLLAKASGVGMTNLPVETALRAQAIPKGKYIKPETNPFTSYRLTKRLPKEA